MPKKGRKHTEAARQKMSESQKRKPPVSEETRQRIAARLRNRKLSPKHCQNISRAVLRAILEGTASRHPSGRSGFFRSKKNNGKLGFASRYELAHYMVLERQPDVVSFIDARRHGIAIPYRLANCQHYYVPDVFVQFADGHQELREVKAAWQLRPGNKEYDANQAKFRAAEAWCAEQVPAIQFRVITGVDLEAVGFDERAIRALKVRDDGQRLLFDPEELKRRRARPAAGEAGGSAE